MDLINIIFHTDIYLNEIINAYGTISYALLFVIIFIETGLVFFPFLPGDSLLFAAGAISAISSINIIYLIVFLFIATFLGDNINYTIGKFFGQRISKKVNQKYLNDAQEFYNKYGTATIFLARFVPIIRTFAPFVAGLGKMDYNKFVAYNALGGLLWVLLFTLSGYFLGNVPQVKENFSIIVVAIIIISFIPVLIGILKNKKHD
jgi:membrane-associated protein